MLTIIDRYIAKNFFGFFVAGIVVFSAIFVVLDFTTTSMRFHVPTDSLIRYYLFYLPIIIYQIMPVGSIIGTLFTLSTLNKNNELIALFSLGLSLARVSAPILVLLAFMSVATFWFGDRVAPMFAQKRNYVWYIEIRNKPGLYSTVKENKIWYRSDNTIFNIRSLNAEKGTAQGITFYFFDDSWSLVQLIKAKSVTMHDRVWDLTDGTVTLFAQESSFPLTKSFEKKTLTMGDDLADIRSALPESETLTSSELRRFIQKNKEAGIDTLRFEVDYYAKMAFAFSGLVLSLMGIPFTVARGRSGGNMLSIGVCVVVSFLYWVIFSASLALGKHGVLPPIVAAWAPNVVMGGAAAYFLVRLKR